MSVRCLDVYAKTTSLPSSLIWLNTAPTAPKLASVSMINIRSDLGNSKIGASHKAFFKLLKLMLHSSDHVTFFSPPDVAAYSGAAIFA